MIGLHDLFSIFPCVATEVTFAIPNIATSRKHSSEVCFDLSQCFATCARLGAKCAYSRYWLGRYQPFVDYLLGTHPPGLCRNRFAGGGVRGFDS